MGCVWCSLLYAQCTVHTHLWMYRFPLVFGRSTCATVVHFVWWRRCLCTMHITLLLLHSNRPTLARIININNNKPVWARFKTAKVLNAYYICGCSFIIVVVVAIIVVNEFVCLNHFFFFLLSHFHHFAFQMLMSNLYHSGMIAVEEKRKMEILENGINTTI